MDDITKCYTETGFEFNKQLKRPLSYFDSSNSFDQRHHYQFMIGDMNWRNDATYEQAVELATQN